MLTTFSVKLLVKISTLTLVCCFALPVQAQDTAAPALTLTHSHGKARLEIRTDGRKPQSLFLKTDATLNPHSAAATVKLLAMAPNKTLVLQDSYASKPGPLSYCQAGQEEFLRVISLVPLKEIQRLKLASCRDNLELATPGLVWQQDSATLKISWLNGPNQGPQEKTLQISPDGKIKLD